MPQYFIKNSSGIEFTADNTVKSLSIDEINLIDMQDSLNTSLYFQAGDNIFLHEIGIFIPYQFSRGALGDAELLLQWENRGATVTGTWLNLGDSLGRITIPEFNQFIAINTALMYPLGSIITDYKMRFVLVNADVNQINGPAILNGDLISCQLIARVTTNFLMSN